jgi:CRISPR system Cascade subunit CasE
MTVHLTQATISLETALRQGLKDVYDWHQTVWTAFPGRDGQKRDFLTRLDRKDCEYRLLIVSPMKPVKPEWVPDAPEAWRTKEIPENYFQHARYRFQLRANPTKKVTAFGLDGKPKKNSRRVPLVKREDLVAWLQRKGEAGGFTVAENSLRILAGGREYFSKQGVTGLHSSVEFEGLLTVTDGAKFFRAFANGIGSAKAFGFGLLVVAPI